MGLQVTRVFTEENVPVVSQFPWKEVRAEIAKVDGTIVFEQDDVRVPESWSQTAVNIVAQKYFSGAQDTPEREISVAQMVKRVVDTIVQGGVKHGYFTTDQESFAFRDELTYILLDQRASFNSPVWFNLGVKSNSKSILSACFINSVEDSMESILELAKTEGMIFKQGGGSGTNLSPIRSSHEMISHKSLAVGPVPFMKGYDAFAGVIKSGTTSRKAACMRILEADHPDIEEFIWCKPLEERKAHDLIEMGHDGDLEGLVYKNLYFQNANHSVRVTDAFMQAAISDGEWALMSRKEQDASWIVKMVRARDILRQMAEAAWECGDPGIQYDTTINEYNPVREIERINSCNPCVTGDTWVLTPDGCVRVDELLDSTEIMLTTEQGPKLAKLIKTGRKRIFHIKTSIGGVIKVTGNHPIKTNRGWIEAANLMESDNLSPHNLVDTIHSERSGESIDFLRFYGFALGDGWVAQTKKHNSPLFKSYLVGMCFGKDDKYALGQYVKFLKTEGLPTNDIKQSSGSVGEPPWNLRVARKAYHARFLRLGYSGKARTKRLGPEIMRLPNDEFYAFLAGYFSADGTCNFRVGKDVNIRFGSASFDLLNDLHIALLGRNVISKLYYRKRPKGGFENSHKYWELIINGDSLRRLARDMIPFMLSRHKAELLSKIMAHPVDNYGHDRWEIKVKEVIDTGVEEDVYDFVVDDVHHFYANGYMVHNCAEFAFVDDSACNLASLNLMKFWHPEKLLEMHDFAHTVRIMIIAQDIIINLAGYPTDKIAHNSLKYRPIGLGYTNLGSLLMRKLMPYDSPEARATAAVITATMHVHALMQSMELAKVLGAFPAYEQCKRSYANVMGLHAGAFQHNVPEYGKYVDPEILSELSAYYDMLPMHIGGFRNAQVTVLAPAGTISFMMDCETTGIEPDIALVKKKKLIGGGIISMVNRDISYILDDLGYDDVMISETMKALTMGDNISNWVLPDEAPIFATALGDNQIFPEGHIKMMAAVQPYLSGGISKCVSGDTIVNTADGMKRIGEIYGGEMVEDSFDSLNLPVSGRGGLNIAAETYYNGVRETVAVTLNDGRRLVGTGGHKILVAGQDSLYWKSLDELEPGDMAAVSLGQDVWGSNQTIEFVPASIYGTQHKGVIFPDRMTEDLATFLGMLTADGHVIRSNYVVGITKNNPEVRTRALELFSSLFGLQAYDKVDARTGVHCILVGSKGLVEFLDHIGFTKECVPSIILGSSRGVCLAYLSGLYLDSYVGSSLRLCQRRDGLLRDVQMIWTNLGIQTYMTDNVVREVNYPVLHVSRHQARDAGKLLTWFEEHKRTRARELSNGINVNKFPFHNIRLELLDKIRFLHKTQEFRNMFDSRTRMIRMSTFLDVATRIEFEFNPEIVEYIYVPVVDVRQSEAQLVYDLSVPETHSYAANGIISHNTVNLPNTATVDDIYNLYMEGWKLGLKSLAIYRDQSKKIQPVTVESKKSIKTVPHAMDVDMEPKIGVIKPTREKLPDTSDNMIRHKFVVANHKGYLKVGRYPDGRPGEIFIVMAKVGSTISGLMETIGILWSIGLQFGVPLDITLRKLSNIRFEPSGFTKNKDIPIAKSLVDYIVKCLAIWFDVDLTNGNGDMSVNELEQNVDGWEDTQICSDCGMEMEKQGTCYICRHCGTSTGCS